MNIKQIEFEQSALQKMFHGVNVLADAVGCTLGPRGHNVVLERGERTPLVTKDGVSVARAIELPDPFHNLGAQTIKEAALRTADLTGDGTTTAIVLARAIFREGLKCVTVGMNPMDVKRGIDIATRAISDAIIAMAKPCASHEALVWICTVSANGDEALAALLADAVSKVGKEGVITIELGRSLTDELQIVEGMDFDRGYLSPYFITDPARQIAALENPLILVHAGKIASIHDFLPLLEMVAEIGRPLLLVAESLSEDVLAMLVSNTTRGVIKVCSVQAPGRGQQQREQLEDVAAVTGATVISEETGIRLVNATVEHLGSAVRVEVSKGRTFLIGGAGEPEAVQSRVQTLRAQLGLAQAPVEREQYEVRLGRLSGGVAVLRIGAASEVEMEHKKASAEDALAAVRAALDEGTVPGGGVALLRARQSVPDIKGTNEDQGAGIRIVLRALEEPLRQIAANAGAHPAVVVNAVLQGTGDFGFDAALGEFADLSTRGIIDPAKVTRTALQNAASVAGLLLTTSCAIAPETSPGDAKSPSRYSNGAP